MAWGHGCLQLKKAVECGLRLSSVVLLLSGRTSVTCVMVIRVFFTFSLLPVQDMHLQKVARSTSYKFLYLPDCIALGHPYRRKNQPNQKMVKGTWAFLFNLLYSSEVSFDGTPCMSCLTCPIYCTPCIHIRYSISRVRLMYLWYHQDYHPVRHWCKDC